MKPILVLLCLFIGARTGFSQDLMRLEDNLTTTFTLTKMTSIQADKIKQRDALGKDTTYYTMVTFGKRRFDIELYQSGTHKLLWKYFPVLEGDDYFKKDVKSSNNTTEAYSFARAIPGGNEKFNVIFLKGAVVTVTISYTSEKTGQTSPTTVIIGSCEL